MDLKLKQKVASAYVCPYGTRGYKLRDGCSIFTAEVEAINKALTYVNLSSSFEMIKWLNLLF